MNPRHVVLETTALPTELYPYIKFATLILYIKIKYMSTIILKKLNKKLIFSKNILTISIRYGRI